MTFFNAFVDHVKSAHKKTKKGIRIFFNKSANGVVKGAKVFAKGTKIFAKGIKSFSDKGAKAHVGSYGFKKKD